MTATLAELEKCRADALEEAAKIADDWKGARSAIGPLHDAGVHFAAAQIADAIRAIAAKEGGTVMTLAELEKRNEWRCFHCDEVFQDEDDARQHFGSYTLDEPGCQLNALEGGILALYREAQKELMKYREEDHESYRAFHALGAAHTVALMRAEEKGYERGLADGRALAAKEARR